MPPVLIPLIAGALPVLGPVALSGAGAGFGTLTWGIASVLAYSVTTAATLGASFLLGQQRKPKGDPQQVTVKQSLPPRWRSYGEVKIAGAYGFIETAGGQLYQLIIHGEGPWHAIDQAWFNDKDGGIDGGGVVTALPWASNITVERHLGAASQTASPMLTVAFPGIWTSDHRLRGLAYTVVKMNWVKEKHFSKVYPNGPPAERVVARSSLLYDPRSATTAYSPNCGLAIRDLIAHPRGMRIDGGLIDDASFAAFADVCDEPVAKAGGGTVPRYVVGLTYELTEAPRDTLRKLLDACDGELYPTAAGKVGIRGGVWAAPTVTLTDDDILAYEYTQGNDRLAAYNRLKLTCTVPAADYQPVEIDPWEDLDSQAEIGVLQQDLNLQQVPEWRQAERLAKIKAAKDNPEHSLRLSTGPAGIRALGERTVNLVISEIDLEASFLIDSCSIRIDQGTLAGLDLDLSSLGPEAYAWDAETEEGTPPTIPQDTSVPVPPPVPTGLALSLVRTQTQVGSFTVRIRGTVDALVDQPWQTIGRYRKVGADDWIDMSEDGDWRIISEIADDGALYEVQAAHVGWGGVNSSSVSAWTASATITATSAPPPDLLATAAVANLGSGTARLTWTNGAGSSHHATQIRRNTANDINTATLIATVIGVPGQSQLYDDVSGAGVQWHWLTAVSVSGARAPDYGPFATNIT